MSSNKLPVRPPQACRVEWGGGASLSSFVQDVSGMDLLVAGAPHEGPGPGTTVDVTVVQPKAMVGLVGVVTRRQAGRLPGFWIQCVEGFKRTQRRHYVRHNMGVRVRYAMLGEEEAGDEVHLHNDTKTVDVSGGGASIHIPLALPEGTVLALELELPERPLYATGRVLRCWPKPEAGWVCAIKFVSIEERERDRLIGVIFQDQRDLRKRGLI